MRCIRLYYSIQEFLQPSVLYSQVVLYLLQDYICKHYLEILSLALIYQASQVAHLQWLPFLSWVPLPSEFLFSGVVRVGREPIASILASRNKDDGKQDFAVYCGCSVISPTVYPSGHAFCGSSANVEIAEASCGANRAFAEGTSQGGSLGSGFLTTRTGEVSRCPFPRRKLGCFAMFSSDPIVVRRFDSSYEVYHD